MQNNKEKKPMNIRALKSGSYSLGICAVVLVLIVVVNLLVGALPSTYTKLDTTAAGLYEISEETKGILTSVDTPVTMYLIAPRGQENAPILELMNRYAGLSPQITVKTVDPLFVSNYTTSTLAANSVIVESAHRHYVVDYNSIYVVSYDNMTEEDYYNYIYYGVEPQGTPYFYGEMMLAQAVDYVSSPSIPTVYTLTGHDESTLSETMKATFKTNNVVLSELGLLGIDGIPEDCSAILLNAPKTDLSVYETEMLTEYLKNGGNMILLTDLRYYSQEEMPNLTSLTALMGMRSEDGILVETNRANYNTYPTYLLPVLGNAGPAEMLTTTNMYTLLPDNHGIVLTGEGDAATGSLLKSTTASFVKKAGDSLTTYEMEEGDVEGSFSVAAYATLGEGKFVWFATPHVLNDQMDYYVNGGNSTVFMASVNWMCEKTVSVSVMAKMMQEQPLVVPAASAVLWLIVLVIVLPVAVLLTGFVIWFRRRRR